VLFIIGIDFKNFVFQGVKKKKKNVVCIVMQGMKRKKEIIIKVGVSRTKNKKKIKK